MVHVLELSVSIRIIVIFLLMTTAEYKQITKRSLEPVDDSEDFDGDVFCKNQSRLIRMEKADEIYIVDTFVNSAILLQCKYCEERDNGLPKTWNRQKHIFTGNISEVEPDTDNNSTSSLIFITKSHSLVFRSIKESDMGLYFCKAPYADTLEKSFNYLIDLSIKSTDEVKGTLKELKNYTNYYLGNVNKILSTKIYSVYKISVKMKVFSDWSEWSECDSCFRKEGIKYRYGKCRVKPVCIDSRECLEQTRKFKALTFNSKQNIEKSVQVEGVVTNPGVVEESLMEFGLALSCKSLLLHNLTPELYNITSVIPDFILNEKCNAPCKGRATKKGPRYRKSIILAKGAHLTLVCPDSTIDSEVRWEHNKRHLHPNEGIGYIDGSTEPRLYVDSFNTLYLFEVTDRESGNYTCFVNGLHMQEVKIIVLTRSLFFTKEFTRHLKYLGFVFLICFIGYLGGVIVMCAKNHSENRRNKKARKKNDDSEKLLKNRSDEECNSDSS